MSTTTKITRGDYELPHQCQIIRRDLVGEKIAANFGKRPRGIRLNDEMMAAATHSYEYLLHTPETASTSWTAFVSTDEFNMWLKAYDCSVFTGSENVWPDPGEPFEVILPLGSANFQTTNLDVDYTFWPDNDLNVYETYIHALYWAVQRGIWHLDVPGNVTWNNEPLKKDWREYIDTSPDAFHLADDSLCVLGQLRGHGLGLPNLPDDLYATSYGPDTKFPSQLGFDAFRRLDISMGAQHDMLTELWRVLIAKSTGITFASTADRLAYLFDESGWDVRQVADLADDAPDA